MIRRIRYKKDSTGNFISVDVIKTMDRNELRAGFLGGDPKAATTGFIKSVGSDAINIKLTASSHHKIKIKIKEALTYLGVNFASEKRKLSDETKRKREEYRRAKKEKKLL